MGRYAGDWEGQGGRAGASRDDPPQGSFRDPKEGWRGSPPLSEEPIQNKPVRRQAGDNDVGFGAGSRPASVPPLQRESGMTDKSQQARADHSTGKKAEAKGTDAQHELNRPEHAKGRPPAHGPSNAGEDGGA